MKINIESKVDLERKQKSYLLDGELDVHQAKELRTSLLEDLEDGNWSYILEMSRITYLDSSGLGMLVYLKKEIMRHGGRLSLIGLQEQVANVFRLTRLDEFFELPPKAAP
ncbi:MAG: STAS domain-containing protein [Candidatus Riflebacteria bacterium]|nr:STAS domain-containing protein [Candidatus Riflebacteria bacterium]